MRTILAWLFVIVEYGCMPMLAGLLWWKEKRKIGIVKAYVYGYLTLLGIFMPLCTGMILIGQTLSHMAYLWILLNLAMIAGLIGKILLKRNLCRIIGNEIKANIRNVLKNYKGMILLILVCVIGSILFVTPSLNDETPEIVNIAITTNTMYGYEPYLIRPYEELCLKAFFPLEMFYAVGVKISGMHSATFVHLALPIFLIPFYAGIGWILGGYFFRKAENAWNKQRLFVDFWMLVGTIIFGTRRMEAYGLFRNIWNVSTLVVCCFFPLILYGILRLMEAVSKRK